MSVQTIDTAPRHTEVLAYRADAGWFVAQYTELTTFLSDLEIEASDYSDEELFDESWFYGDTYGNGRLEGNEIPTHWVALPDDIEKTP